MPQARGRRESGETAPRFSRALLKDTTEELTAQLLSLLPYSEVRGLSDVEVRDQWASLRIGEQTRPKVVWDPSLRRMIAFLFNGDGNEPVAGITLTPLQEPHEHDMRFIQILCRIFNEDLRTAPDARTQELWQILTASRFARSIGRFSDFSTLPFMRWLRTIESASHLRYEGSGFSASIFMTKHREWIEGAVKTFVPFSKPLDFEEALLREKWIRSLAADLDLGLVGLGHTGSIVGVITLPRRRAQTITPPYSAVSGAVSLVRAGTMAFICAATGDLYVVLPNGGTFLRTQGQWHHLNYSSFRRLLEQHLPKAIVRPLVRMLLDLSFQRKGALLCFIDDNKAISQVVPDYTTRNRTNLTLRMAARNLDLSKATHQPILLAAAGIDGAMVFAKSGRLLDSACLIGDPDQAALARSGNAKLIRFPGARSTAAWNASVFGLSIKVSEDGPITVYKAGKLIGQMA